VFTSGAAEFLIFGQFRDRPEVPPSRVRRIARVFLLLPFFG
jgi:hypothetical protein